MTYTQPSLLLAALFAATLTACGESKIPAADSGDVLPVKIGASAPLTDPQAHIDQDKENGTRMAIEDAKAVDMPELAKKSGCVGCHAIDKKVVGPGWMDVANKYKSAKTYSFGGKDYPLEEGLLMKVSKGGSGNWGTMTMPPQDASGKKQAEMTELVKFVLSLAK